MGKILAYGSIDCTKITKSKMINNKAGKPAYVNVVIWQNDEPDKYGNMFSITESQSKEERESGQKAVYLGNLKASGQPTVVIESNDPKEIRSQGQEDGTDILPF